MRENEKGFTLVEVLGVLIILSIIVVITVPLVQDKIAESRGNSFLASVDGYLRATRAKNTEDGTSGFVITSGEIHPAVDHSGTVVGEGEITYNSLGKAQLFIWNDPYCVVKGYEESEPHVVSGVTSYEQCKEQES